ncbi:MAG TPA: hypothetical protein VE127_03725 [Solirubrobacteraceae bacterium]|nr:hypothetical protein [Solirubrobacteraceae bacterium]
MKGVNHGWERPGTPGIRLVDRPTFARSTPGSSPGSRPLERSALIRGEQLVARLATG